MIENDEMSERMRQRNENETKRIESNQPTTALEGRRQQQQQQQCELFMNFGAAAIRNVWLSHVALSLTLSFECVLL